MKRFAIVISFLLNLAVYAEGFLAGTPVKTPNGYVPIEQIKTGDNVYSYNFNGYYTPSIVIKVIKRSAQSLMKVTIDDEIFFSSIYQLFIAVLHPLQCYLATNFENGLQLPGADCTCVISSSEIINESASVYSLVTSYGNFCISNHNLFAYTCVSLCHTQIVQAFQESFPARYHWKTRNKLKDAGNSG